MARIVVIATGGTIASTTGPAGGGAVAQRSAADITADMSFGSVQVESQDLFSRGSYLLEHRDLRLIVDAVRGAVARDDVDGVVITHGTDTMEETAFLLDLVHHGDKPVVLTGAQRAADQPDTDGPRNVRDAVAVAAALDARGLGSVIVFDGLIFPAARTRKQHTIASEPFAALDAGPVGQVRDGEVRIHARAVRPGALPSPDERFDHTRVDVVVLYPGADAVLPRAAVAAGAAAVVLAGTGVGNTNHTVVDWARDAVRSGTVVALGTRVAEGPVLPLYGNGGGVDLMAAGAVSLGSLPLYHGRLLLALLLSQGTTVTEDALRPYV